MLKNAVKFHVFENREIVINKLADYFINIHNKTNNRFYIFPGGITPTGFYKELSGRNVDWTGTRILLSDERLVDTTEDRSNEKLINENFLGKIKNGIPKPTLVNISDTAYYSSLTPEFTLLGIGKDGHTASLYADEPEIFTRSACRFYCKTKNMHENIYRLSLTFYYLLKSRQIFFLILGMEKNNILFSLVNGKYEPLKYPAQYLIKNHKGMINIYCDKETLGDLIYE